MKLVKADKSDLETILQMQTEAFMPMLQKYRDYETSPANEKYEDILFRFIYY